MGGEHYLTEKEKCERVDILSVVRWSGYLEAQDGSRRDRGVRLAAAGIRDGVVKILHTGGHGLFSFLQLETQVESNIDSDLFNTSIAILANSLCIV